uniref:Putative basic leucine zipper 6-like isoform X2 n=1 Tax=Cymbidium ensifolium TaxID=78740 RepID=A0A5C1YU21_CYMEN|nr:putative basic leucine zipper 6-like isoform X2 [Cymbidium ensifolium]
MSKLPPKFPSNISGIPRNTSHSFNQPRHHSMSSPSDAPPSSSWAEEFYDFTSSKRGSHRRAMSDSITFFESASSPPDIDAAVINFDGFDEDQLMSMFSDVPQPLSSSQPSSVPSSPSSDQNSMSDQDKQTTPNSSGNDQSEAQNASINSAKTPLAAVPVSAANKTSTPNTSQHIIDPKRVKRVLANRQSAQRSRVRKLHYISDLEKSVNTLQTEVSALSPRVALLDHQRSVLSVGNSQLKQRIAALAQDKIFKEAHREVLQNEIARLRKLYHMQYQKKRANVSTVMSNGSSVDANKKLDMSGGINHHPSSEC